MKRLIKAGLMFGNLFEVDSPVLVERYNRALQHLTGKRTALTSFHIDISGYAPEIGQELGDQNYLNPEGVNRQFILLSTEQKRCPLLNVMFSTSRDILRQFIEANEAQLFTLTARDAVAGELANSVYALRTPAQVLDVRKIRVEADTTDGALRDAEALRGLIERFESEEDGWFDDVLIADMISLAQVTGDVIRNPVDLSVPEFEQRDFWTAHFGGLYVFQEVKHPAVIAVDPAQVDGQMPLEVIPLSDPHRVARFLEQNDLVEPIVAARGMESAVVLRQKMDFIIVDVAAAAGIDLKGLSRADLRRLARRHADQLPQVFHGLSALVNWAESGARWPQISSGDPAYFYTLRAVPGPDADLVNMLLSELTPHDVRQLFICHKELFYRHYRNWSDAKKDYVVDFLVSEYQVDKAGARAALFGPEPEMSQAAPRRRDDDLIHRVGPWGALRKG